MPSAYATKLAEGFSNKLLIEMYDKSQLDVIVNRDYEGEINAVGSKLNILAFDRVTEKDYTGANLTADDIYEKNAVLVIEKQKSFYFKVKTIDQWKSYIKNPKPKIVTQTGEERNRNMEIYAFGFYPDVAAGNRVGTDATAGTVTVDVTTGVVTGSGTAFTAAMIGKGFKATGHSIWYRVKAYSSATSITIEDDFDDVDSAYTGGAIGAGATYTIEAVTAVSITTSNLLDKVAALKLRLDIADRLGKSAVPDSGRFLIVPPEFGPILVKASGVALHVPDAYQDLVKKGMITMLQGFMVFQSNRLTGDNTDGFHCLAGHSNWLTFAEKPLEVGMDEDLIGNFGSAYKDLFVYGGKVTDKRRHFCTELFATFATS